MTVQEFLVQMLGVEDLRIALTCVAVAGAVLFAVLLGCVIWLWLRVQDFNDDAVNTAEQLFKLGLEQNALGNAQKNLAHAQEKQVQHGLFLTQSQALTLAAALHAYISTLSDYTELGENGRKRLQTAQKTLDMLHASLELNPRGFKAL